jgi:hypothetical protein
MENPMSAAVEEAVLFEIDKKSWDTLLDRTERWFHHVQMVQTGFRKLVEDTLPKMHDSHLCQYLTEILERAKDHEGKSDELLRMIGRDPTVSRKLLGTGFAKTREVMADIQGSSGGAMSGWRGSCQPGRYRCVWRSAGSWSSAQAGRNH